MRKWIWRIWVVSFWTVAALGAGDDAPPTMEIGTNFWDIQWGGPRNQPFTTPYNEFVHVENPWRPEFLAELSIYRSLRFMDWIKTNSVEKEWARGNPYHRDWASRTRRDDPVQRPVAYEWMIDLCNRTGNHLWLTVPHVVDDDYVTSLARLIRAQLSPDLQCYVEWSNETWNGMFSQAQYVNRLGQQIPDEQLEGFRYSKKNEWYTGQVYHAVRTLQVHQLFLDVFGEAGRDRLVLVMGGTTNHAFYRDSHLYAIRNRALNSAGVTPDVYALAPYIGNGVDPEAPDAFDILAGPALEKRLAGVAKVSALMKENGIGMVCYEGGQHIKHTLKAAVPFQKRPEMYALYTTYLTALAEHVSHFSHYTHTGGSWGAKEYIGEDEAHTPKYNALRDWALKHHARP